MLCNVACLFSATNPFKCRVVMTVFKPITSQHFETTLSQNKVVSNTIKRDHWIEIMYINQLYNILGYFYSFRALSVQ